MKKLMVVSIFAIFVFGALSPVITASGKSHFLQACKDVFHYTEKDAVRPGVKETPTKFEDTMKQQIRYPEQKSETK